MVQRHAAANGIPASLVHRVIMREIRTKPGQLFSRADIIRTQRELAQLGYFDQEKLEETWKCVTGPDCKYSIKQHDHVLIGFNNNPLAWNRPLWSRVDAEARAHEVHGAVVERRVRPPAVVATHEAEGVARGPVRPMLVAERDRQVRILARDESHERLAAVPHVIVAEVVVQDGRCQADFALGELPRFRWLHQVKRPSAQRDTDRDRYLSAEEAKEYGIVDEILTKPPVTGDDKEKD